MTRTSHWLRLLALIIAADLGANTAAQAGPVMDPAGDFRTFDPNNTLSYAGPQNPALDVMSVNVTLDTSQNTFTLMQTMAGPISGLIDPTTGALLGSYSWGINHGYSSSNFAELGLPNILFDAVLTLNPNGTGSYRGAATPAGAITVSGDTLMAVLPVSFLAPPPQPANAQGPLLPDTQWSFNLWPRSSITTTGATLAFGDAQIADFAPDAMDFGVQARPRAVERGDPRHGPPRRRAAGFATQSQGAGNSLGRMRSVRQGRENASPEMPWRHFYFVEKTARDRGG